MAKQKSKSASANSTKPSKSSELNQIEELVEMMNRHGVAELEWTKGSEKIHLRTSMGSPTYLAPPLPALHHGSHVASAPALSQNTPQASAAPANANHKQILSPFVGTFYRAPSPNAPEYVRESQNVKKGDVVCIIEAMKLMNEIEAEWGGKIVAILVENGQPVEFGEALFTIET